MKKVSPIPEDRNAAFRRTSPYVFLCTPVGPPLAPRRNAEAPSSDQTNAARRKRRPYSIFKVTGFRNCTRFISIAIASLALLASARAELTVVSAEHREAAFFKRFSEYFTGKENQGRYTIFRSDPSRRDGFYISLIAEKGSPLEDVTSVRIRFVRPASQDIDTIELPVESIEKRRLLFGLTETEWADKGIRPVAWHVALLDQRGTTLDSAQSFLWSE